MKQFSTILLTGIVLLALAVSAGQAREMEGVVKAGYTSTDLEGNQSLYEPTYNLEEGFAFSLDRFRYQMENGLKLSADLHNPFLDNRRLKFGVVKSGHGGVNFKHNAYKRPYDFDGKEFTRRYSSSGSIWMRPVKQVKLFGGFGYVEKNGTSINFADPSPVAEMHEVDFARQSYYGGVELKHERSYGRFEYRTTDFNNDRDTSTDRKAMRLRATFYTPIPQYEKVVVSGGFQHFQNRLENRFDTLQANSFWGAAQYSHRWGYSLRYSFMFDRARRTGDPVDTDNLIHAVHLGKAWPRKGGVTVGYSRRLNDDLAVKRSADEYSLSGWVRPIDRLTVRASMNMLSDVIDSGRTLTGAYDRSRHSVSAKYSLKDAYVKISVSDRRRENDDIGSKVEFMRTVGELSYTNRLYGRIAGSIAYGDGKYENTAGMFEYEELSLTGQFWSAEYKKMQGGIRGIYYRAKQDIDIESFSVEFSGRIRTQDRIGVELVYSVHNYDDLDAPIVMYDQYYTANVITALVTYDL